MTPAAHILILEDDPGVARLQQKRLERDGYDVSVVDSVGAAEDMLTQRSADLVLLDYCLADNCNGLEAYERLKASHRNVPAILITGFSSEELVVEALRSGFRDFVPKSIDYLAYLSAAVRQVLHGARVEQALAESEELHRITLSSVAEAVLITDDQGRFVYVCPSVKVAFGYDVDEVMALGSIERLLGPDFNHDPIGACGEIHNIEHQITDKRGAPHTLLVNLKRVSIRGGTLLYSCRDITERKHLEEQLRQSQKMEAIGRLAGGVAHDFNNLLTIILGNTELMFEQVGDSSDLAATLREVLDAAKRAAALTHQLLAFSRRQACEPQVVNLNQLVSNVDRLLARLIGAHIRVVTRPSDDLWAVRIDPVQFEQILFNLAVNARDAMPAGGQLTIETCNVELDGDYTRLRPDAPPGAYVRMAVNDTGVGIAPEAMDRLFEPFFTTKAVGKGTGMGLATVFGIVNQCGGHIGVYSEPMRGASFHVHLPRWAATPTVDENAPSDAILHGTETVLVIEDEPPLRRLARSMLENYGFEVLEAASGQEALDIAAAASKIDLALTDVVMPEMGGRELARRLTAAHPGVRVLFMSGFSRSTADDGELESFIQKPFTRAALAQSVRALLDAPSAMNDALDTIGTT